MSSDAYDPRITVHGNGPAVVLVPGMDGTGALFYRQTPALARSYRVATYALRDSAATYEELHDDLARVIDRVSPDGSPAILIGESFGGTLALSFTLARAERVSSLVVLNSFAHFDPQIRLQPPSSACRCCRGARWRSSAA
jgi:pimeloyl-ACP methyl ester carboxylesterase